MKKWLFYVLAFVFVFAYVSGLPSETIRWLSDVVVFTLIVPVCVLFASATLICNFYFAKNYDNDTRFAMSMALGSFGALAVYQLLPFVISWSQIVREQLGTNNELGLASILMSVVVFFGNVVSSRLW